MEQTTQLFVWGTFVHLVADWVLQNEWMTRYKRDLRHPAGWVHGTIHTVMLLLVFPWAASLFVGLVHVLVDTRKPLEWWLRYYKHLSDGPHRLTVEIWVDQVMHLMVIALAAFAVPYFGL